MKKLVLLISVFMLTLSAVTAQVAVDPNDRFYEEAQVWEVRGLIDRLPQIRPYPLNLIKSILEKVALAGLNEDGSRNELYKADVDLALYEYERIFSKPFHVRGTAGGGLGVSNDRTNGGTDTSKFLEGKAAIVGDVALHPLVSFSYDIGEYGNIGSWKNVSPDYTNFPFDSIHDPASIGPLDIYFDANSNISAGTKDFYATAGVSRVGFGPFLGQGLCLNETSYHSANMFVNASSKYVSFTTLFSAIGATTNVNAKDDLSSSKYFAVHSIRFSPFSWLGISFYESVVFGGRTEFLYLVPAPFMVVQGLGGNRDNLQMGLLFEYDVIRNLRLNLDIFIDDLDAEKLAKLKLDGKNRFGIQAGFFYTPPRSVCKSFAMNYTLITPYTYSHWQCVSAESGQITGSTFNYQNYTNNGINIGSTLQPDSDKIGFIARFQPKKNLKLTLSSNFVRHQNVIEALTDEEAGRYMIAKTGTYRTDGSVYTHSLYSAENETDTSGDHVESAWSSLNFMSGTHSMYTCQAGFKAEYEIPSAKKWRITLKFGYTFEYVHNKGVDSALYAGNSTGYIKNADGTYTYTSDRTGESVTKSSLTELANSTEVQDDVTESYENWVKNLYDCVNNYFYLGVKLTY